jgi:hypothetical protein
VPEVTLPTRQREQPDVVPQLRPRIYLVAGGQHDDGDETDRVMAAGERTATPSEFS